MLHVVAPEKLLHWTEAKAQECIGSGGIFVTPDLDNPTPSSILGHWTGINKSSLSRLLDLDFPRCAQCMELYSLEYLILTLLLRPDFASQPWRG